MMEHWTFFWWNIKHFRLNKTSSNFADPSTSMLSWSIIVWTSEHFYIELNIDIMPTYNWTFYIKYQRLNIWDFVTKVLVLDNHHEHFSTSTVNILMIKSYSLCIHIIRFLRLNFEHWRTKFLFSYLQTLLVDYYPRRTHSNPMNFKNYIIFCLWTVIHHLKPLICESNASQLPFSEIYPPLFAAAWWRLMGQDSVKCRPQKHLCKQSVACRQRLMRTPIFNLTPLADAAKGSF